MGRKQTYQGPYKVYLVDGLWEVVEIENHKVSLLKPRKRYENRQAAYGLMARLNKKFGVKK